MLNMTQDLDGDCGKTTCTSSNFGMDVSVMRKKVVWTRNDCYWRCSYRAHDCYAKLLGLVVGGASVHHTPVNPGIGSSF